ncbi:MAG: NAD(P)-dependent oxidoreductase, partial [Gemmatimonadota bacterium]|nr:NAD(P)-dependent oxidoreductase [Gemmatimonadota bacterium]
MRVLVTGADGFVGGYLLRALADAGHAVIAAHRRGAIAPAGDAVPLELEDRRSVEDIAALPADAVVHLAAVASG